MGAESALAEKATGLSRDAVIPGSSSSEGSEGFSYINLGNLRRSSPARLLSLRPAAQQEMLGLIWGSRLSIRWPPLPKLGCVFWDAPGCEAQPRSAPVGMGKRWVHRVDCRARAHFEVSF